MTKCARMGVNLTWIQDRKKSIFTLMKQFMAAESLDVLMTIYEDFKTDDPAVADYVIAVLMPGAPANNPVNMHVQVVHSRLTKHVPKLQAPNIGNRRGAYR